MTPIANIKEQIILRLYYKYVYQRLAKVYYDIAAYNVNSVVCYVFQLLQPHANIHIYYLL